MTDGVARAPASRWGSRRRGPRRSFWPIPLVLAGSSALAGCSRGGGADGPAPAAEHAPRPAPPAAAAAAEERRDPQPAGAPSRSEPALRHGIAWYEDAPGAAFAAARASGKRVIVDLWAPWCHTCLSMQDVVLTASNLPALAERFVWLAIDTEREENARLLERLPVSVWPTFYVVDAKNGEADLEIRGRWLGAASPQQFARFVTESDAAPSAEASVEATASALAQADELAARGRHAEAAAAYGALLARAPRAWPRRPEALVAQMTALWKASDIDGCLKLAEASLDQTGSSASAVDFSHYALECAARAPAGAEARSAALRQALVRRLEPLCDVGTPELSPDDRADACDKLASARAASGDADGAKRATLARLAVLERASFGKSSEQALTYDWARTDALLQLGRAEEALAIATERERQLPENYNPPHYRAKSLAALGRWEEGLAAIARALSLAYGPRKIGLLTLKADLLLGAGRQAEARATLREQLAQYRALPAGQRQPAAQARVEQRLRDVDRSVPTR